MKASDLQPGDVVDHIRKDLTVESVGPQYVRVAYRDGVEATFYLDSQHGEWANLRRPEPPKPAHWPPQAGDVWLSQTGTEWHIVTDDPANPDPAKKLIARPDDGTAWPTYDTRAVTERCTLVYRKGDSR